MLVKTPGGSFKTQHLCPLVTLNLRGVDFPAQLIVMESDGVNVILGEDWLNRHNGIVYCSKNTVVLTSPTGEEIEVVTSLPRSEPTSMD